MTADTAPKRIQLRRTKGWRKPDGAIVVSRPTKWSSPFPVGKTVFQKWEMGSEQKHEEITVRDRQHAKELFERWVQTNWGDPRWIRGHLADLRGHDLACWCPPDAACHADVLLELANPRLTAPLSADREENQ